MQFCLESLKKAMPADAKLKFRTSTRTLGRNSGHVSVTDYKNKRTRGLLVVTNAMYNYACLFSLQMCIGANVKRKKMEVIFSACKDGHIHR